MAWSGGLGGRSSNAHPMSGKGISDGLPLNASLPGLKERGEPIGKGSERIHTSCD